jgi:hypothetical protein
MAIPVDALKKSPQPQKPGNQYLEINQKQTDMKGIIAAFLLLEGISLFAQQKDSFDLVSYSIPKGWKKEKGNGNVSHTITDTKTGAYAKLIIYKSIPGSNNLQADFDKEWAELIATPYKTLNKPETTEEELPGGWKVKTGTAPFVFNSKKSAATLITGISNGHKISLAILTNSEKYQQDIETIGNSIQLKEAPRIQTQIPPAPDNIYTFTTSTFDDGWKSTVHNDYVLLEKNNYSVYLNFSVPYNASQFSGTGIRDAEFYWDNYVTKLFKVKTKQLNDGGSMALKPPYMEGYATDNRTGKSCFIGMYLNIVPNAVNIIIGTAPSEAAFRQLFPKANDPFGSDLSTMTRYNKFAVAANDLIGKWQNGNTETAQWYYVSPSGYEGYAGMTVAATSATFLFNSNNTYTSIHNGATGAVGNMKTFQQEYHGNYNVSNWMITATNRYGGKTDRFDAFFLAVRGGRILKLNNNAGQDYSLVKAK